MHGISLYPGLDNTSEENLTLLKKAYSCGFRRVFTSLHIPETNREALQDELSQLLHTAREYGMEIISDISPVTLDMLGLSSFRPRDFATLGITTLRLDYGFGLNEMAELSHNREGLRIQLNASTISEIFLQELIKRGADTSRLDALHNFYPRRGTGISEEFFRKKTEFLHQNGISVGAFVSSMPPARRRSPLKDGLPTLEEHRDVSAFWSARHLLAMGADSVFLSESLPTDSELTEMGRLPDDSTLILRVKLYTSQQEIKELLSHGFSARPDEARDAIRANESRDLLKAMKLTIAPENTIARPVGSITLDNHAYARYMGELQIVRHPQPADSRINVIAQVVEEDLPLLRYITPERKFSFLFVESAL